MRDDEKKNAAIFKAPQVEARIKKEVIRDEALERVINDEIRVEHQKHEATPFTRTPKEAAEWHHYDQLEARLKTERDGLAAIENAQRPHIKQHEHDMAADAHAKRTAEEMAARIARSEAAKEAAKHPGEGFDIAKSFDAASKAAGDYVSAASKTVNGWINGTGEDHPVLQAARHAAHPAKTVIIHGGKHESHEKLAQLTPAQHGGHGKGHSGHEPA